MHLSLPRRSPSRTRITERHYVAYLVVIALAGWALASYDLNLLTLTLPDIATSLHLSVFQVGALGFIVYGAMFVVNLFVGFGMDTIGRRRMWMICLTGAAVLTGLTYFVGTFWQLAAVRAAASGSSISELAISITIVNEQVGARRRGLLYSIVQGGWPVGVFLASGAYKLLIGYGWRTVFLVGIIPLIVVIIGRFFIRESDRFVHLKEVKEARRQHDDRRVTELLHRYDVDVGEVGKVTVKQLFAKPGFVRRQLLLLTVIWLFYQSSFAATGIYITYWLVKYKGYTGSQAASLLLVAAGIGFFFYILGGALGEKWGRREILIGTGILVAPLNLAFFFAGGFWAVAIIYFLIYQVTNGTWSGTGYAYWAECFPTRVRGTAVGFLGAMTGAGYVIGSGLWTLLQTFTTPAVTWLVIAVGLALGQWLTVFLRRIPPGRELESIAI
jgi:MFS family permease